MRWGTLSDHKVAHVDKEASLNLVSMVVLIYKRKTF